LRNGAMTLKEGFMRPAMPMASYSKDALIATTGNWKCFNCSGRNKSCFGELSYSRSKASPQASRKNIDSPEMAANDWKS